VLRRSDQGESDRRIVLLTRASGKITVLAKGARKGGSRLAAATEPTTCGIFHLHEGRAARFLTQFEPRTTWPGLRSDYDALLAALALCEAWDALVPFESPAEDLLDLAQGVMAVLDAGGAPWPTLAWALVQGLHAEGQGRDWMTCMATGERISERPAYLSDRLGGPVGRGPAVSDPGALPVEPEVLMTLNKLAERPSPPAKLLAAGAVLAALHHHWRGIASGPMKAVAQAADQARRASAE
jgi:DNA repair protein RecO (recombination protein O)